MTEKIKIWAIGLACIAGLSLVFLPAVQAGLVHWLTVMGRMQVGGSTPVGQFTVHNRSASRDIIVAQGVSGQTGDLLDLQDSAGTTLAKIGSAGALTTTGVTNSGDATAVDGTFSGTVTVNGNLYVDGDGVSDVQGRFDGTSGQAVDIFQVRLYDGTEQIDVSSAGAIGLYGAVVCSTTLGVTGVSTLDDAVDIAGAVTMDEDVTLGDAVTDTTTVSGPLVASDSIKPERVTADPCTATGYGPGSIFYNATSNYMCFCDGSTDDIKMNDNSTACF